MVLTQIEIGSKVNKSFKKETDEHFHQSASRNFGIYIESLILTSRTGFGTIDERRLFNIQRFKTLNLTEYRPTLLLSNFIRKVWPLLQGYM